MNWCKYPRTEEYDETEREGLHYHFAYWPADFNKIPYTSRSQALYIVQPTPAEDKFILQWGPINKISFKAGEILGEYPSLSAAQAAYLIIASASKSGSNP